ncbi:ubiquitin-like domain-containing protein [Corynebacterium choanae]|uniref:Resuscitation-promoting factor Rpf2 n=1 Tax=Corynebacterium choanae TaxID=1862358 RepID=A0A3G6J4V7_9CORY|nr:ubiquitin-like domain-containing protein [Corynebacterium choanae]AZA13125.1 Resuscitation-promoting factor Rpf2 precursor [Corynebacterium choanae]
MTGRHSQAHWRQLNGTTSMPLRVGTGGMLVTLALSGMMVLTEKKEIELVQDGHTRRIVTIGNTVHRALAQSGVKLTGQDVVSPALDHRIHNGMRVTIERIPASFQQLHSPARAGHAPQSQVLAAGSGQALQVSQQAVTPESWRDVRASLLRQLPSAVIVAQELAPESLIAQSEVHEPATSNDADTVATTPAAPQDETTPVNPAQGQIVAEVHPVTSPAPAEEASPPGTAVPAPEPEPAPQPVEVAPPAPAAVPAPDPAPAVVAAVPAGNCQSGVTVVTFGENGGNAAEAAAAHAAAAQQAALNQLYCR